MSRGLGKLQRLIKELIEAQGQRWKQECDRLEREESDDEPKGHFWLTWFDIRVRLFKDGMEKWPYWDRPDNPLWLVHERAAKRALHTLWKRGEIGRIDRGRRGPYLYMTAETWNESFSPQAEAKLKECLEAMATANSEPVEDAA